VFKRLLFASLVLSIQISIVNAVPPWNYYEDFSSDVSILGDRLWFGDDVLPELSYWPDYRINNVINGTNLGYHADDEAEQNGIIYIRKPDGYQNTVDGLNGNQYWNTGSNESIYPSWSLTLRINLNPSFIPSNSSGFVEGGLLIRNQWSGLGSSEYATKQGYWLGFGIKQNGEKYLATDMFGTGTSADYFQGANLSTDNLYLRIDFNANLLSISSFYTEDIENPGYFWNNPFRTENINSWNSPHEEFKTILIGFGGYSNATTVSAGDVSMDDLNFNLIPEPSALSLLVVGLGGLAMIRRRRS